ncbi:MerR family transcriptional regulator [Stutzerimonas urumqiensis]|uniref:MerR family transcriptional regulator n=1 Tax=Stutzerimonas urumqiensis TaxID=638269 RepID=UPI003BABCD10
MRIGQLARMTGTSERMLRYYEEQGLLAPPRTAAGYRQYGEREVRTVQAIRQLNGAGLRLEQIRIVLPCMLDDTPRFHPCAAVRASLRKELERIEAQLSDLERSRRLLSVMVNQVEAG